jgi:predicted phosphodiesterase
MTALFLSKSIHKLLVIGPSYDRLNEVSLRIEELISNYDCVIINGGICYPSDNLELVKERIQKINQLASTNKVIYVAGRNDLTLLSKTDDQEIIEWIRGCYNMVVVKFPSRTVLVMDGGVPQGTRSLEQLIESIEISFVSQINNKPWHHSYNGGLGYVISNNPLSDKSPEYYNYSMQLGNLYSSQATVYAQEMDEVGLKKTILI